MVLAGFVAVIVVTLVNLLLLWAVIRRLKQHEEAHVLPAIGPRLLEPGTRVPRFSCSNARGQRLSSDDLPGGALVGFFSATCPACRDAVSEYRSTAAKGDKPAYAVIVAEGNYASLQELLAQFASVFIEPPDGPMAQAFEVNAFPSFFHLDSSSVVLESGTRPDATASMTPT